MKKIITAIASAFVLAAAALPAGAAAEDSYIPGLYFRGQETSGVALDADGNTTVSRSQLKAMDYTLTADVFIEDDSLTCWEVAPKWKCASRFITLCNLVDPLPMQDGMPNLIYAYAETNDEGELVSIRHGTLVSTDTELNTMAFTCQVKSYTNRGPMIPYGERSDDYALTSFDMKLSRNIPYGEYTVYFLTEAEDYADQRFSEVAVRSDAGSEVLSPRVSSLTVTVTGSNPGDINNDGKIDSTDASAALIAYAKSSTGADHGLTELQFEAADTDKNGAVNSADATNILMYYSYVSTSGELSFEEFFS